MPEDRICPRVKRYPKFLSSSLSLKPRAESFMSSGMGWGVWKVARRDGSKRNEEGGRVRSSGTALHGMGLPCRRLDAHGWMHVRCSTMPCQSREAQPVGQVVRCGSPGVCHAADRMLGAGEELRDSNRGGERREAREALSPYKHRAIHPSDNSNKQAADCTHTAASTDSIRSVISRSSRQRVPATHALLSQRST